MPYASGGPPGANFLKKVGQKLLLCTAGSRCEILSLFSFSQIGGLDLS
jgi:hypothetical protein